jgi:hypothetical protein
MAAEVGKILAQGAPVGGQLFDLFTVPEGKQATVKVVVCNRGSVDAFRFAVSPALAAIAPEHYMAYDFVIAANDSRTSSAFVVQAGDVVRVRSTNGDISFTLTGIEESL